MDRLSLPWRHRLRMGAELALMKLLLQQWPPLFARGLAGVAAAVILFSIAKAREQPLEVPREAVPRLLFASFTNVFAWMGFSTVAMKFVPVGEGALIVYTMPIWATLLAWPLAGIRPKLVDIAALVLGVGGITVLLGGDGFSFDSGRIIGIALLFSAAILFAIGNILNRVACRCRRWSWSPGRSGSAASRC